MGVWDLVAGPILKIIDKVIPDKAASQAVKDQISQAAAAGTLQEELLQLQAVTVNQSEINKVEAANSSVFVAGWRPAIGWVCAVALASQYILRPIIAWGFSCMHQPIPTLPGIDDNLWQLMFGMLGMGALRSYDKVKGVATK